MAELTEDNLELELRRSTDEDEGKSVPLSKLKPMFYALTWGRLFCLYVGIVVKAHSSKARDLLAYLVTLLAGARKVIGGGLSYESCSQQAAPSTRLDQALFTRTIFSAGGTGHNQQSGPVSQVEGRNSQPVKRCKLAPCFAWNDEKSCTATPCHYSHVCLRCSGEHRKTSCSPPMENPSVPVSSF